jgi:MFS family permease
LAVSPLLPNTLLLYDRYSLWSEDMRRISFRSWSGRSKDVSWRPGYPWALGWSGTQMSLFVLGTVGCAFSPTMGVMIGSRIVAGSGGGGLFTVSSIIIADLVSLADRGLYQGSSVPPFLKW